jgi:hypothetical protein
MAVDRGRKWRSPNECGGGVALRVQYLAVKCLGAGLQRASAWCPPTISRRCLSPRLVSSSEAPPTAARASDGRLRPGSTHAAAAATALNSSSTHQSVLACECWHYSSWRHPARVGRRQEAIAVQAEPSPRWCQGLGPGRRRGASPRRTWVAVNWWSGPPGRASNTGTSPPV